MASISCDRAASELLRQCIAREPWDRDLVSLLATNACSDALFRILVEGLADRFEPRLCDAYADIFSTILEQSTPSLNAKKIRSRYERIRGPRVSNIEPENIVVLSRVTLGADIAITSVILDALKRRFPVAAIYLAGDEKAAELFAGDSRVRHLSTPYPRRGTLVDRILSWDLLRAAIPTRKTIVVDPDSRLTQLGLLPLCDEKHYFFFESRGFGGDGNASLGELTANWASETFDIEKPQARISPPAVTFDIQKPCVTVSLGTGGNDLKRLPASFEADLIRLLCARFSDVIVDEGFGPEEALRVARAIARTKARLFRGSFAQFASVVAQSDCYVGYDSAGQHAAAAFGTPLLTLFAGFVSNRMFARWQPTGPGPKRILKLTAAPSLDTVTASLESLIRTV